MVARYENLHSKCPYAFIQQSASWAHVIKDEGPDVPIFILCEYRGKDVAGYPLYLYKGQHGNVLTSIPQPGPIGGIFHLPGLSEQERFEIYETIIDYTLTIAARHKCILFSTTTNPLFDDWMFYETSLCPDVILENFSQFIDLNENQRRSRGVNSNINQSYRSQLKFQKSYDYNLFRQWYEIHKERFIELEVEPIRETIFLNILSVLVKKGKAEFFSVMSGNKVVTGGFVIFHIKVMDLYMLNLDRSYSYKNANYYCMNEVLKYAVAGGKRYFNWQSSKNKHDGVYQFKKGWGSRDTSYFMLSKLLCGKERIREIGLENIKKYYQNHYLLPYGFFSSDEDTKYFVKGEA